MLMIGVYMMSQSAANALPQQLWLSDSQQLWLSDPLDHHHDSVTKLRKKLRLFEQYGWDLEEDLWLSESTAEQDETPDYLWRQSRDQKIAEHAALVIAALGAMLISKTEAQQVNRLDSRNKRLERQAKQAESLEQFLLLKNHYRQNRQQMVSINQRIFFWDSLTLAVLGLEGYWLQRDLDVAKLQKSWSEKIWQPLLTVHPSFASEMPAASVSLNWKW